jgi:hypothetical protein
LTAAGIGAGADELDACAEARLCAGHRALCSRFGNAVTPPLLVFLMLTLSGCASFYVLGAITAV